MKRCSHIVGFLTRVPCGEPAEGFCSRCGIPLCFRHQRPEGGGMVCPSCIGAGTADHDSTSSLDHGTSYSTADYDTFDRMQGGGGEMGGGGASGSWDEGGADDSDDSGGGDAGSFQDS